MPDAFYLDSDTFQKASADIWERSTHTALADRWAAQATAQVPDQLAQARDAQNKANAERWAQDAAAKYAAVNPPESPQDAPQPAHPTESPSAPPDQQVATVAPPTAIPMAPVPMGPMDTAAPVSPPAPVTPTSPVTAPLRAPASDLEQTVRQSAARHGIDPDTAVRVAQSEGGLSNAATPGDQGSSFGPFQLHYGNVAQGGNAVAGLGDEFTRQTGLDARDPANVVQAIDFALQHAASNGWGAFHGAARAGIAAMEGIGQAASNAGQAVATAIKDPSTILDTVKPFLGQPYVWGGKGPQQGFDCSGLAGYLTTGQPESTTTLYGKSATVNQDQAQPGDLVFWNMGSSDPHQQHVAVYLGNGKIVQSGGNQAAVNIGDVNQSIGSPPEFRRVGPGGTPAQASAPPGAPSPADTPTYADVMQPAEPAASSAAAQSSVWEKLGTGISDVFKNLFGGSGPAPQTGIPAVDALTGGINLTDPTRSAVGNNPVAPAGSVPTTGQLAQTALASPAVQDVAFNGPIGAQNAVTRGATQAVGGVISDLGQTGPGRFKAEYFPSVLDPNHPVNVLSDPNATDEQKQNAMVAVVSGVEGGGLSKSTNPLIQRTGQMLEAKPPGPPSQGIIERLVQASTNRFVAADRYQEDALKAAGLSKANPPESLDLSAALRLASNPAAEVRVQQGLAPAIQMVGETDRPWLSAYLMHANNVDVGAALGNADRTFPGGFKAADSAQVLNALPNEIGPQRMATVEQAAQQVYSFTNQLRQRMVDSGLISQDTASQWAGQYPHWVPTRVLDYIDETQNPAARVGSKVSLGDNQVRSYTEEGTSKFAEDPLASLIGLAGQVERLAMKNDAANALVELDNLAPAGQRMLVATDRPVTAGESVIQRINNGTVERYVAPPALANVINGPQITQAPGFVRNWTSFIRSMTTVLSPAFALVRNPSLDIPEYMTRELARSGGNPLVIPHLIGALARGYVDAFQGFRPLTEGTFAGAGAQQFMLGGGGQSGMVGRTFAQRGDAVARLAADGRVLGSVQDVTRVLKDLVTLKPVARTAERTELGPRIASMRLAEQRGATPVRAVLNGRSVTIDFNEGGTLAKTINQFVPFFNAGVQGSANVVRMFRENPAGAVLAATQMAGLPAVMAETWNNADPQRAKDYADVPDYLKAQGVVVMLPGEAPVDDRGNRRPQFWWINMRGLSPFSTLARDVTQQVLKLAGNGNVQPQDWAGLSGDLASGLSPIRANTIGDLPGSVMPQFVPGADVGVQLALNKDIFRGSDIVSPRRDQYASEVSKAIAGGLTAVARQADPSWQVHPAQVDFAVQQMLGGVGSSILGAGQAVAGVRRDTAPQSLPVAGGLVKALGVRGDTGQALQEARAHTLTADAQRVINDSGLQPPQPVLGTVHYQGFAIPLHQSEQAAYQESYTRHVSDLITRYAKTLTGSADAIQKQQIMSQITRAAQTQAEGEILRTIPGKDLNQRIREEDVRRRAGQR